MNQNLLNFIFILLIARCSLVCGKLGIQCIQLSLRCKPIRIDFRIRICRSQTILSQCSYECAIMLRDTQCTRIVYDHQMAEFLSKAQYRKNESTNIRMNTLNNIFVQRNVVETLRITYFALFSVFRNGQHQMFENH